MTNAKNDNAVTETAAAAKNTVITKKAGAFDIRNVIGALIGLYGLVLLVSYLVLDPGVNPDTGMAKNSVYNLYTGIALVVVAVIFFVWAKLRPTEVETEPLKTPQGGPGADADHPREN